MGAAVGSQSGRRSSVGYLCVAADLKAAASSDTSGHPDKLPEAERYTRHAIAGSAPAADSTSAPFTKNDGDPVNPQAFASSSEAIVMVSTDSAAHPSDRAASDSRSAASLSFGQPGTTIN